VSSTERKKDARSVAGNLVIDHRGKLDLLGPAILVGAYLGSAQSKSFDDVLGPTTRSSLYSSLATTSGALLGFALTALAILVALPSTDRLEALRDNSKWERVPRAFLRAAWALLIALVLCTLGITFDDGTLPAETYEAFVVASLSLALVRVVGATIALDHVMAVARTTAPLRKPIDDPGP
jgi:predicted lysophospholipase L1 biosynthesis ABC-type transport system permease subunit